MGLTGGTLLHIRYLKKKRAYVTSENITFIVRPQEAVIVLLAALPLVQQSWPSLCREDAVMQTKVIAGRA